MHFILRDLVGITCIFQLSTCNNEKKGVTTYITNNLSALLATDQRDVFLVQAVACSFSAVPLRFVMFLQQENTLKCQINK